MSSPLKRELLFWLCSAAAIGAYVAAGHWLAPRPLPKPERSASPEGPVNLKTVVEQLRKDNEAQQAWKRSLNERNRFLRNWYRWGAGVGIVLVLIYTWRHPPWRLTDNGDARQPNRRSKQTTGLPVSRHLVIGLLAILVFLTVALLSAVLFSR